MRQVAIPSNRVNVSYVLSRITCSSATSASRNPLKSGQCFLPQFQVFVGIVIWKEKKVAIPSNRVNVSYSTSQSTKIKKRTISRNPLKSGQCFLRALWIKKDKQHHLVLSQSPQIGSMFLTKICVVIWGILSLIYILSQSPQIGSMFLTHSICLKRNGA